MIATVRKIFVIVFCLVFAAGFTACLNRFNADDSSSSEGSGVSGDAPITSDWDYYCVRNQDIVQYRYAGMPEDSTPHFKTEDGVNFELTITGGKRYKGTITENPDGTYELHHRNSEKTVNVSIEGDKLTLTFSEDKQIEFRAASNGTGNAG